MDNKDQIKKSESEDYLKLIKELELLESTTRDEDGSDYYEEIEKVKDLFEEIHDLSKEIKEFEIKQDTNEILKKMEERRKKIRKSSKETLDTLSSDN